MKTHVEQVDSLRCQDTSLISSNPATSCRNAHPENQSPSESLENTRETLDPYGSSSPQGTCYVLAASTWGKWQRRSMGAKAFSIHNTPGLTSSLIKMKLMCKNLDFPNIDRVVSI